MYKASTYLTSLCIVIMDGAKETSFPWCIQIFFCLHFDFYSSKPKFRFIVCSAGIRRNFSFFGTDLIGIENVSFFPPLFVPRFPLTWLNTQLMWMVWAHCVSWMQSRRVVWPAASSSTRLPPVSCMAKSRRSRRRKPHLFIPAHLTVQLTNAPNAADSRGSKHKIYSLFTFVSDCTWSFKHIQIAWNLSCTLSFLWINILMNVCEWIEKCFIVLTSFEFASHPGAKRRIEDWSGSLFNKDTFISTALSTHFQLTHTCTPTHTHAHAHTHTHPHTCINTGCTRVLAIRFNVLRCLSALPPDTFPICQHSIWSWIGGAYQAAPPLIRPEKLEAEVAVVNSLHLKFTSWPVA